MFALAEQALERASKKEPSAGAEESPFKLAMREAFEAVKSGDLDAFSGAFEAAVAIKLATREEPKVEETDELPL